MSTIVTNKIPTAMIGLNFGRYIIVAKLLVTGRPTPDKAQLGTRFKEGGVEKRFF